MAHCGSFSGREEIPLELMQRPEPNIVVRYWWCLLHLLLRCVRRIRLNSASSTDSLEFNPQGPGQAASRQNNGTSMRLCLINNTENFGGYYSIILYEFHYFPSNHISHYHF